MAARRDIFLGAVEHARQAGVPEHNVGKLRQMVLGDYFHAFWRALTSDPPARVEPMRVTLKAGVNLSRVIAKQRNYYTKNTACMNEQNEQVRRCRNCIPSFAFNEPGHGR